MSRVKICVLTRLRRWYLRALNLSQLVPLNYSLSTTASQLQPLNYSLSTTSVQR
jgi:hypothetical protein